jgi:hypothetical protein
MDFRPEHSEAGENDSERWKLFRPFPRQTSTLITGPAFLGKSTLVRKLVEYQHLFFQDPVTRLVVINCNSQVTFAPLEEPTDLSTLQRPLAQLVQHTWEDFSVGDLQERDVLLIDDLQRFTEKVRELVTAVTHHLSLGHCFVITHSVLGNKQGQFELLNLVHRVALFCKSTAVSKLASYVLSTRIFDPDLKARLREALGAAERSREILVLELSALPESVQPRHIACSHLLRLTQADSGFAVVYPHPSLVEMYEEEAEASESLDLRRPEESKNLPGPTEFVAGSFLILRPEQVEELRRPQKKRKKKIGGDGSRESGGESQSGSESGPRRDKCLEKDEETWNKVVLQMEEDVENFLPNRQWRVCKSLLYEILRNPVICLLDDGRRIKLRSRPGVVCCLIDYLAAATRRDTPSEKKTKGKTTEFKNFRQVTAALLSSHAPKTLFKNSLVRPGPAEARSQAGGKNFAGRRGAEERRKRRRQPARHKNKRGNGDLGRRRRRQRDSPPSSSSSSPSPLSLSSPPPSSSPSADKDSVPFGDLDFSSLHN